MEDFRLSMVMLDHCGIGGSVARTDVKSPAAVCSSSPVDCCISDCGLGPIMPPLASGSPESSRWILAEGFSKEVGPPSLLTRSGTATGRQHGVWLGCMAPTFVLYLKWDVCEGQLTATTQFDTLYRVTNSAGPSNPREYLPGLGR